MGDYSAIKVEALWDRMKHMLSNLICLFLYLMALFTWGPRLSDGTAHVGLDLCLALKRENKGPDECWSSPYSDRNQWNNPKAPFNFLTFSLQHHFTLWSAVGLALQAPHTPPLSPGLALQAQSIPPKSSGSALQTQTFLQRALVWPYKSRIPLQRALASGWGAGGTQCCKVKLHSLQRPFPFPSLSAPIFPKETTQNCLPQHSLPFCPTLTAHANESSEKAAN